MPDNNVESMEPAKLYGSGDDYRALTPYEYMLIGGLVDENTYTNPRVPIGISDGSLSLEDVVRQRGDKAVIASHYAWKMFGKAGEPVSYRYALVFELAELALDTHEVKEELPRMIGVYDAVDQKLNRDLGVVGRSHYTVEDLRRLPLPNVQYREGESTQR